MSRYIYGDAYTDDRPEVDMVNHPSHYETGNIQCFDVILETQGRQAAMDFCICNAMKYIYRHRNKNGREDIEKAVWYLDRYLELAPSDEGCKDVKVGF